MTISTAEPTSSTGAADQVETSAKSVEGRELPDSKVECNVAKCLPTLRRADHVLIGGCDGGIGAWEWTGSKHAGAPCVDRPPCADVLVVTSSSSLRCWAPSALTSRPCHSLAMGYDAKWVSLLRIRCCGKNRGFVVRVVIYLLLVAEEVCVFACMWRCFGIDCCEPLETSCDATFWHGLICSETCQMCEYHNAGFFAVWVGRSDLKLCAWRCIRDRIRFGSRASELSDNSLSLTHPPTPRSNVNILKLPSDLRGVQRTHVDCILSGTCAPS